jgi:protoporphyrinogen IX oxidase
MTAEGRTRTIRAIVALAITAGVFAALLTWWPPELYRWILAVHVMAVIAWMAGMFYLPRLFVYHCGAEPGSQQSETFKTMERRLLTQIINPAMVVTWTAGLWMIWTQNLIQAGWMQAKLVFVLLLSGFHGMLVAHVRDFAADRNRRPHTYYRVINEVPTLLMMAIVILAIVKPF